MPPSKEQAKAVDDEMQRWNQGDIVPASALSFVHVADLTCPLTPQAEDLAAVDSDPEDSLGIVDTRVDTGFVVLSQTCDVVRSCAFRPFVEVAVLHPVSAQDMAYVKRAQMPRFALVPALEARSQVADLDRTMTIEKAVLAQITDDQRVQGCRDDAERQAFAAALSRKHGRFAFPDDFSPAAGKMFDRIKDKHGNNSPEGAFLDALYAIRVECAEGWDAPEIHLRFLFIQTQVGVEQEPAQALAQQIVARFKASAKYAKPEVVVVSLATLSAERYLASYPLDLDYLSSSTDAEPS